MKPHLVQRGGGHRARSEVPTPRPPQPGDLAAKPENVAVVRKAHGGREHRGHLGARRSAARPIPAAARPARRRWSPSGRGEKYNARKMDERQRDHALYIAYRAGRRPQDRAGDGGGERRLRRRRTPRRSPAACSTTGCMGLYPSEEDMAAVRKGKATTPIGKPRNAADVAWPPAGSAAAARWRPRRCHGIDGSACCRCCDGPGAGLGSGQDLAALSLSARGGDRPPPAAAHCALARPTCRALRRTAPTACR